MTQEKKKSLSEIVAMSVIKGVGLGLTFYPIYTLLEAIGREKIIKYLRDEQTIHTSLRVAGTYTALTLGMEGAVRCYQYIKEKK